MNKITFFCLLTTIVCLTSCVSMTEAEKKQKANEDLAVSVIQNNLKCPSTMKIVSCVQQQNQELVIYDTLYRVNKIKYGRYEMIWDEKIEYDPVEVSIDAMKVLTRTFPAHISCKVTYDAQNSFGAMVRESGTVVIDSLNQAMFIDDFVDKIMNCPKENIIVFNEPIISKNIPDRDKSKINIGEWLKSDILFE